MFPLTLPTRVVPEIPKSPRLRVISSFRLSPLAFSAVVVDVANGQSDAAKYKKNGNIKVDGSGDIFIYVE